VKDQVPVQEARHSRRRWRVQLEYQLLASGEAGTNQVSRWKRWAGPWFSDRWLHRAYPVCATDSLWSNEHQALWPHPYNDTRVAAGARLRAVEPGDAEFRGERGLASAHVWPPCTTSAPRCLVTHERFSTVLFAKIRFAQSAERTGLGAAQPVPRASSELRRPASPQRACDLPLRTRYPGIAVRYVAGHSVPLAGGDGQVLAWSATKSAWAWSTASG
jgi:hypothetical protein